MARERKRPRGRPQGRADQPMAPLPGANGGEHPEEIGGAPAPLEHATPDAELAEAQLRAGRPADVAQPANGEGGDPPLGETHPAAAVPARREPTGVRLVEFARGSWRELQRVQWPDRRQVMQATGVVIGFVIVAGAYLGLADAVASKIVNLILK